VMQQQPTRGGGISRATLPLLQTLHQRFPTAFTVAEAAEATGVETPRAHQLLAYLAQRGWLERVRRGLYVAVPLEAHVQGQWREDAWVIAAKTFDPCYIGGWSACEHWGLTEQIFREVVVLCGRRVRDRHPTIQDFSYLVRAIQPDHLFGIGSVWRGQVRVQVSDPSKTLVDILDTPALGGGIAHIAAVLTEYLREPLRDDQALLAYTLRAGNRSVFKRLGYLTQLVCPEQTALISACHENISSGVTLLDPGHPAGGSVDRSWGLRVNVPVQVDP